MKKIIRQVLDDMKDSQINLGSSAARETVTKLLTTALKSKGNYVEFQTGESYSNINDKGEIDDDAIGGRVEFEEPETKHFADGFHEGRWEDDDIQKQAYIEMTSDGLPTGGDTQAVLESHKLAEEIVNAKKDDWIYESPDGGKTVFRRKSRDYDMKNKVEIDWKTKEPTGRIFTDYPFEEKGDEG
jgi:hypothetical protein|tara:strand:- start:362 stop:916 length:555 start_codon:yes stop_codon:yes gene_type:complete